MYAKDRHRMKLLEYLGDPENDYPPRNVYPKILGISRPILYKHFRPSDLLDIEAEAYELRKKNSVKQRAEIMKAMLAEAKTGNVSAANLFLDRTEGKVVEHHNHKISLLEDLITGAIK